jgi:prepilin-type N-terminal cleavage/methylation domain-containing protein
MMKQKKTQAAFTLVELLVVLAIISFLMAVIMPALQLARAHGDETVCRSHLRQMVMALKTYTNDNNGVFPPSRYLYHSRFSFSDEEPWKQYLSCCRWHDARIGFDSPLLRTEHPEFRGALWSYLGNHKIVRCKIGRRANERRGCSNACVVCVHNPAIPIVPQYTYVMNESLGSSVYTATSASGSPGDAVDSRTMRRWDIIKETQVTRSPAEVFAFGEKNSWAINIEGRQPIGVNRPWAAAYNLSGKYYIELPPLQRGLWGTLVLSDLNIETTYDVGGTTAPKDDRYTGDAFATYHRPRKGDLNTGHSYVAMLDAHVERVTAVDQLRRSRQVPGLGESRLGPGGNLFLAWPVNVPPPGGWENQ